MSARRGPRPVIVEFKPDSAPAVAPPSPSPSGSPKVRFASTSSGPVAGVSRPLTSVEAWSLYHFENHARKCEACYEPYEVYRRRQWLCPEGLALAQDVAYHVQQLDGEIYSKGDESKSSGSANKGGSGSSPAFVRVEVPHGYTMLRSLLKAMDRGMRTMHRPRSSHRHQSPVSSTSRTSTTAPAPAPSTRRPIVSYDRAHPVDTRRSSAREDPAGPAEIVVEPSRSTRKSHTHRHDQRKHRSSSSSTKHAEFAEAVDSAFEDDGTDDDDDDATAEAEGSIRGKRVYRDRKGTLYEKDMQRKKAAYRVEVREPRRREERPRGSVYL